MSKKNNTTKIIVGVVVIALLVVVGVSLLFLSKRGDKTTFGDKKSKTILTVNEDAYSIEDMLYYIYNEEEMGYLYNDIYMQFYGMSYWDMPDEENGNKTGEEIAKENVISQLKKDAVLYNEAKKAGYTLSDSDKEEAKENYNSFISEFTEEQKKVSGVSDALLTYFEHQVLIDYYKADLLDESDFDSDKVEATVSKEDCREYDYEYYSFDKTNEEGEDYSEDEIAAKLDELNGLQAELKADTDMNALLSDKDIDDIEYADDYIVVEDIKEGGGYGKYNGINIDKEITSLENGECTEVLETDWAYYVFRMKNNDSKDYYDEAVEDAIKEAHDAIFDKMYENVKSEYTFVLDEEEWDKVVIGSMIYAIDTENEETDQEQSESGEEDFSISFD